MPKPVAVPPSRKLNAKDGLTYSRIPAGTSLLGCSAADAPCFQWEKPPHRATLKEFWIGQTEVTQEAYASVTGTNPSRYQGARLPADQISWRNAQTYCTAIGMRLPTGDEWEYAARSPMGSPRQPVDAVAWFDTNSADVTHPVALKQPNSYGLYDMLGNVWEWVQDDYGNSVSTNFKTLRGGSFVNSTAEMRPPNFLWATPDTAHRNIGFRCAGD